MKSRRLHISLVVLFIVFLSNCNLWPFTIDEVQNEPGIPNLEEFYISLEKFTTNIDNINNDMFYNWRGAVLPALYWAELLNAYDSLFYAYQLCTFDEPEHFGGKTWYWTANLPTFTFEIFATPSLNSYYYEGYLITDNGSNRYKAFEGYYSEENEEGLFRFYTEYDTLVITWSSDGIIKTYQLYNYDEDLHETMQYTQFDTTQYYEITTNTLEDTAFIYINSDMSGQVKNHDYFEDYNWHCWHTNLMNSDCTNIIDIGEKETN